MPNMVELVKELYDLTCSLQNTEAKLSRVLDEYSDIEYVLRQHAWTHGLQEGVYEITGLIVEYINSGFSVYSPDQWEKLGREEIPVPLK